ncbi:MAG: hypothetical protein P8Y83_05750 [Gammaproteobacteria bacterium]
MLKKILESLKYFAVAAIVAALILLGFQLGKENNRELVQHLQGEKVRLETELSKARDENTRLLLEQTRASVVKPETPLTDNDVAQTAQPSQPEPAETPTETAIPAEPALEQISETFSTGAAPASSEQGAPQE